jgi:uncharacterized protein YjbI with pentapeptide repeats
MDKKVSIIKDHETPLRPNMLMLNADATSSTIARTNFSHCVVTESKMFNSRFHESNFEGTAYDGCDFDGAVFSGCSFRGVEFANCDVDHLVINGINVGNLLRVAMGDLGGKR